MSYDRTILRQKEQEERALAVRNKKSDRLSLLAPTFNPTIEDLPVSLIFKKT